MRRGLGLLGATFLVSSFGYGQSRDPFEGLQKSLQTFPAIRFTELKQCVTPGGNPATATTRFGTPGTGSKAAFSSAMTYSWPTAGVYQQAEYAVKGNAWKSDDPAGPTSMAEYFDGTTFCEVGDFGGRQSIYYRERGDNRPTVVQQFALYDGEQASCKVTGQSVDPKFGPIIHVESQFETFDVAPERDYMIVHRKASQVEEWVLDTQKIQGHWLATTTKTVNSFRTPVEIYTTIKDIKPLEAKDQIFKPTIKPGAFVMKNNVYYDDDKAGKWVKSKNQPDRTTEYLTWAGMVLFAVGILSVLVIGIYKIVISGRQTTQN